MHIEVKNLIKEYKGTPAVRDVSLHVKKGEIVGLLGPNGAGKTTTFYMIVGIEKPTSGKVFISDIDITRLPINERADLGISYLAQEASIFRKLTVEDNLRAILQTRNLSKKEQDKKIDDLLEEFNITHIRTRLGMQLSGGERRRVEIARGLALEPHFILLDEPFVGIDSVSEDIIMNTLRELRDKGKLILIVHHDLSKVPHYFDQVILLNRKLIASGPTNLVFNEDNLRKTYGNSLFYKGDVNDF